VKSYTIKFLILILLFVTAIFLNITLAGSKYISLLEIHASDFIFWQLRFPKTITAIIAGTSLSVAGLILQIIFRNPLAGPYVLGISSGASLMVAITILTGTSAGLFGNYFIGKSIVVLSSITGSVLVTLLILILAKKIRSNVILLLVGLMIGQICGAIQGALEYFAEPGNLKSFVLWGMGSLSGTTNADLLIYLPVSLFALLSIVFFIRPLDAFLLGENYALNAGIDYTKIRFVLIFISSLLTGITTAFCGPIAFIGIAVPLLSRMLFNSSRQGLHLVSSSLIGATIILTADVLCHTFSDSYTLPINMITTFIGAPLVIYLLFKNKQW
jgi:iron complex transport system permease protein